MTLVVINRNPQKLNDEQLKILVSSLPESVASVLSCNDSGGDLTAQDIEVEVHDFGPYDINIKPLKITIWADYYPQRKKTLELRRKVLCSGVKYLLHGKINGFVRIFLNDASSGEF